MSADIIHVDFQTRQVVGKEESKRQEKEETILQLLTDQRESPELVQEFCDTFEPPMDPEFWRGLIREEAKEVKEAAAHLLKELSDLEYVTVGHMLAKGDPAAALAVVKTVMDDEIILDLLDAFPPEVERAAMLRVHYSNMSKAMPDGSVKRREDGKVLKGPNYKPAELQDLLA
jgi:hypothetical protein